MVHLSLMVMVKPVCDHTSAFIFRLFLLAMSFPFVAHERFSLSLSSLKVILLWCSIIQLLHIIELLHVHENELHT